MKALLHGIGRGPRGHDLLALGAHAREAGFAANAELDDALARLARHYIATRYPDAHAAGSAASRYRAADSAEAIADAERVRFVVAAWRHDGA